MQNKFKVYIKNVYSQLEIIAGLKIFAVGALAFLCSFYFLGMTAAICSIISGVGLFYFNYKGFSRKRVTNRSIYFLLSLFLAVFLPFIAKDNNVALTLITFLFIGTVAFFALEEHIGGFLAHIPITFVYLYSFFNKDIHSVFLGILGVVIGVSIAYIILQLFCKGNPEDRMKNALESYLDALISEVHKNRSKINSKEKYTKFLSEFYKTSYGSHLSDGLGKKCFDFTLCLHQLLESYREKKRNKTISKEGILQLENFLIKIKNNEEIDTTNLKMPQNIMAILVKKRKILYKQEKVKKDIYKINGSKLKRFVSGLSIHSIRMRHGIKIGLIMSIGVYIYINYGMTKAIWLPMILIIVVVPYGSKSNKKIFDRIVGTVLGLITVSFLMSYIPSGEARVVVSLFAFYPSFVFMRYSYMALTFFATISSVLLSVVYLSVENAFFERMMYTLMAGVIIYVIEFLVKDRSNHTIKARSVQVLENDLIFVNKMMSFYEYEGVGHLDDCMIKCFLNREVLANDLHNQGSFDVPESLRDSMIFLDKIMLVYAKIKNHDMDKESIQELSVVSNFLKRYILFIKTKKIKYLKESDKQINIRLEGDTIKDESVVDIFKLMKYCIENAVTKKHIIN